MKMRITIKDKQRKIKNRRFILRTIQRIKNLINQAQIKIMEMIRKINTIKIKKL